MGPEPRLERGPVPRKVDVVIHSSLILDHVGESDPMFKQTPVLRWLEATRRQARFFEDRPESVSGAGVILTSLGGYRARSRSADYKVEARAQEILEEHSSLFIAGH